jgi:lysozyme
VYLCVELIKLICELETALSVHYDTRMKLVALSILLLVCSAIDAKTFLSCELAKEFGKNGMDRSLIPHWVCLVQAESQGNTSKVVQLPNQSANYGIFQINSKEHCHKDKKGGWCNIKCSGMSHVTFNIDFVLCKI